MEPGGLEILRPFRPVRRDASHDRIEVMLDEVAIQEQAEVVQVFEGVASFLSRTHS